MNNIQPYSLFAPIFAYPTEAYKTEVDNLQAFLNEHYPLAAKCFQPFSNYVASTPSEQIEEVYTKTFHIQAVCYLDLGYVIFGEDYKRGEFLVNMKHEQDLAENDCGNDLADNLVNVLTLLPKLKDQEFKEELIVRILIPALEKMLAEFKSSKMDLREKVLKKVQKVVIQQGLPFGNIFQSALSALLEVCKTAYSSTTLKAYTQVPEGYYGNFLSGCGISCSTSSSDTSTTNTNTTSTIKTL
ncbi:MAG: hypothetical protein HUU48_03430 [Flavobacteriales bacterium]|nr:hypothetical protein [Flavobacteriales bacterium]